MRKLLSHFEKGLHRSLDLLEQMVNMDSPSSDKAAVDRFARFAGSHFESIGGIVEYVPVEKFGDHVLARFSGRSEARTLLLGHTDTVFGPGESSRRPFAISDGRATGPGVFDMKAGILLMFLALEALGDLRKSVTVLLTSDEEIGSPSSRDLVQKEAAGAEAVLVLEPSLPGGGLKTARKGVGRFTVKAIGRAAHAGIDPEKGVNAIEEIASQVLRLQSLSDTGRGTTVTVGVIQGGTRSNVIPAEAVVEVDVRIAGTEEAARITEIIRGLMPNLSGARLVVRGGINRPPMERSAGIAQLFGIAQSVAAEIGLTLVEGSTGGASDGNFTAAMGIPTLDGLGAVGGRAHAPDEFVEIQSLPHRAALIAGLLERI